MSQDSDNKCFEKARGRGQRTFTLVEQDVMAPCIIGEWIVYGILHGVPREKLHAALDDACDFRDSQVVKKVPD